MLHQRAVVEQLVGERDARAAREVVVARARLAQRLRELTAFSPTGAALSPARLASASSASATCGPASCASRRRPTLVIVTSPARSSLLQVAGHRRRRDAHPHRQRTRRQRRAAEQLLEHPRAGPVGERGGDVGEVGHSLQATPATLRRAPKRRAPIVGRMLLADPAYTVPDPGPPGPYGTMAWLRATVSRFAKARPTPAAARSSSRCWPTSTRRTCARPPREWREGTPPRHTRGERNLDRALHDEGCSRAAGAASATAAAGPARRRLRPRPLGRRPRAAPAVDLPYVPVAVLATALGVAPSHLADAVAATRLVAAAYHPHTDAPGADAALAQLLSVLAAAASRRSSPRASRSSCRRARRRPGSSGGMISRCP